MVSAASRAQSLPFDVVVPILSFVVDDDTENEWTHGRDLGWEDHHGVAAASVVCRAWREPSTAVLYTSVSIQGQRTAETFLATLHTRPELAAKVRWIAVGVGEEKEDQQLADDEIINASKRVVQVLAACPNLEHILLRPLHSSVRPALVDVLRRRPLKTLITRAAISDPPWTQGFCLEDFILPTLRHLHIDWWRQHPSDSDHSPQAYTISTPLPVLTHYETQSNISHGVLVSVVAHSVSVLRVFKLYYERLPNTPFAASILSQAVNLRRLTFVANPPLSYLDTFDPQAEPLVNRVLPYLPHLNFVDVTATEISPTFLRVAPASLAQVVIRSLNWFGFAYDPSLVEDLRQSHLAVGLRELTVWDTVERWEVAEIEEVGAACASRGARWSFLSGDDELEDDGSE